MYLLLLEHIRAQLPQIVLWRLKDSWHMLCLSHLILNDVLGRRIFSVTPKAIVLCPHAVTVALKKILTVSKELG